MKYIAIMRMSVKRQFAYNWSVFFNVFTSVISILILSYFWKTLYPDDRTQYGYMLNYAIVAQLLGTFYASSAAKKLSSGIKTGAISVDLLRPWNYILGLFSEDIGAVVVNFTVMTIPVVIIARIFFGFYFAAPLRLLMFLISVLLSLVLLFLIKIMIGMFSFWILEAQSMLILINVVINFFSGQFLPDWIMPDRLKDIMNSLPFIWIYQKPIEIYLSGMSRSALDFHGYITFLLMQFLWISALSAVLLFMWKRAVKKLAIQGG